MSGGNLNSIYASYVHQPQPDLKNVISEE